MIKQTNHLAGGDAEPRSGANAADWPLSPGRINIAVDEPIRTMELERTAIPARPEGVRIADSGTMEAFAERRSKLAARIREENPSCTEEYIVARLEQFGA